MASWSGSAFHLRPTRLGSAFVGISLLMVAGSITGQTPAGFLLSFLMLGVWFQSAAECQVAAGHHRLHLRQEGDLFAEEPFTLHWTLEHLAERRVQGSAGRLARFWTARFWTGGQSGLQWHLITGPGGGAAPLHPVGAAGVHPRPGLRHASTASTAGTVPLPGLRRGVHDTERWHSRVRDPLGFWEGTRALAAAPRLTVAPKPEHPAVPLPEWPFTPATRTGPHQRVGSDRTALDRAHYQAQSPEDAGTLRPYRPGDPRGQIHWRLAAKTGALHVSDPGPPPQGAPLLLLDLPAARTAEEQERRLSRLCAWVLMAEARRVPYLLRLNPGETDLPTSGHEPPTLSTRQDALGALARCHQPAPRA